MLTEPMRRLTELGPATVNPVFSFPLRPLEVHLPSFTVFSNFPANKAAVQQANCLAFSPHSGFFSLANNKGHAPLFR